MPETKSTLAVCALVAVASYALSDIFPAPSLFALGFVACLLTIHLFEAADSDP